MIISTKYLVAGILLIFGIGSYYIGPFKGKADNPIEQFAEKELQEETGLDIDLSPEGDDDDQ